MIMRLLVLLLFFSTSLAFGQSQADVVNNVKASLKAGSSKELVRYFNEIVSLNVDGEKSNYSKTQAEIIMKDFFTANPPSSFEYIHQGNSKEGLLYTIGQYTHPNGTYRVYMLLKSFNGKYLVDTLDLTKE
jgi:hypothetical protein